MARAIQQALPRCGDAVGLAATPLRRLLPLRAPLGLTLRPLLGGLPGLGALRRLLLLACGSPPPRCFLRLVHHRRRARHRWRRRRVHRLHHAGASPAALREVVWLEHRISYAGCPWAWLIAYPGNAVTQVSARNRRARRLPSSNRASLAYVRTNQNTCSAVPDRFAPSERAPGPARSSSRQPAAAAPQCRAGLVRPKAVKPDTRSVGLRTRGGGGDKLA